MEVSTLTTFLEKSLEELSTISQHLDVDVTYGDDFELIIGKKLEVPSHLTHFVNLVLPTNGACRCEDRI